MTTEMSRCRVCFTDHLPEEYICLACRARFACASLTVTAPLGNGAILRAHIVAGIIPATTDACGEVIRSVPVARAEHPATAIGPRYEAR